MKVGIITFHRAINYGAVLQTYALQAALDQLDIASEVIDYRCPKIEETYREYRSKEALRHGRPLLYLQYNRKNEKFSRFFSEHIRFSGHCYQNHEELLAAENRYDAFLTGSDQVWNPFCTDSDTAFLLDFVHTARKKNSYAASFGVGELPETWKARARELLKDFNKISVRERQGEKMIEDLLGRKVSAHVDPVLLLGQEEWGRIAAFPKERDYIFVYLMERSGTIDRFVEDLSRRTGCGVIYFNTGLRRPVHAKYIRTGSPEEFVGYLVNARYVVTNSFHGTAFSILFHKAFFTELLQPLKSKDSRLENILELFQLRDRQIVNGHCEAAEKAIDYEQVDRILKLEREKSMDYLREVLGLRDE